MEDTVVHPDFWNPKDLESALMEGVGSTGGAILVLATAVGLGILTPAAFATFRNSFSSLLLSFSFLSSAALASTPDKLIPLAFAAISFIRAL